MRLAALTALVMTAFAANSILNRMAVGPGLIGATDFALIRAVAGAAMLAALVVLRRSSLPLLSTAPHPRRAGPCCLPRGLLTGLSGHRRRHRRADPVRRCATDHVRGRGSGGGGDGRAALDRGGLAMAGLAWLVWPVGDVALPWLATLAMLAAALGWGIYSLVGRRATDPWRRRRRTSYWPHRYARWRFWLGRARRWT
jgi:hypothetical protein